MEERTEESAELEIRPEADAMTITNTGAFTSLESLKDAYGIGKMWAQSKLIPAAYQGNPMDCTIAVDIANRMGVSPMFVMQNLWVVQGIPSWSGQACMGIIRGTGRFKDVKPVYTGNKGDDTWGCYISAVETATGKEVRGTEITIQMAKNEGWMRNPKWKNMPEQMLAYRAATFFARVYCPNELMGFKVEGEAEDITRPATRARNIYESEGKNAD